MVSSTRALQTPYLKSQLNPLTYLISRDAAILRPQTLDHEALKPQTLDHEALKTHHPRLSTCTNSGELQQAPP